MADDVEVKLGADAGPAKAGIEDAASSIAASLQGIQTSLQKFTTTNRQMRDDAIKNNADLSRSFLELKASATGGFNAITGVVERFRGVIGGLAAAIAGGFAFDKSVSSMLALEDAVRGLVISFGMSTVKATETATALKLAGLSAETYEMMGQRVGRVLKTQSEEFDRLGVVTKDASGNLLPMDQILQNIYTRMQDFKAGTDQTEFALSTVGRNAKDFASDMERLTSATERAAEVQARLGIQMGPDRIAAVERYRQRVNEFKIVLDTLGDRIGEAVLPRLQLLAEWLIEVGPSAIDKIVVAVKLFVTGLEIVAQAVQMVWAAIKTLVVVLYDASKGISDTAKALAHLDFSGAADAAKAAWEQMKSDAKNAWDDIVKTTEDRVRRINALWGEVGTGFGMNDRGVGQSGGLPRAGKERFTPKPTGGGSDDRLAAWKDELVQMQEAQGFFNEFSKSQEADFWAAKLAQVRTNGAADVALRRELNRLIFEDRKAAAREELQDDLAKWAQMITAAQNNKDKQIGIAVARTATLKAIYGEDSKEYQAALNEELKLRQDWVKKEEAIMRVRTKMIEDAAAAEITLEQESVNQQLALREISVQQKLAAEQQFEDRLYALKLKALEDEKATLEAGTLAYVQVEAKIEALEQAHQLKLTQIANQAELDRKQVAIQAAQDVENAFGTFIDDLISRNKTLKQSFQDLVKSITADLNKLASQEIAKQLFGAGTQGGSFLNNIFGKIFGGGASGGGDAAATAAHTTAVTADTAAVTTSTTVMTTAFTALSTAAEAAAAALGSVGGGGFGGLFGGSSAGAGSVLGMFGDIPFFDVGTPYVPQDTLAVVHRGEAIVPASMNRAGVMGHNVTQHMHFYISGNPDSRTLDQIHAAAARGASKATRSIM